MREGWNRTGVCVCVCHMQKGGQHAHTHFIQLIHTHHTVYTPNTPDTQDLTHFIHLAHTHTHLIHHLTHAAIGGFSGKDVNLHTRRSKSGPSGGFTIKPQIKLKPHDDVTTFRQPALMNQNILSKRTCSKELKPN